MKTQPVKRSLALLLCLAMLFTLLPCSALAADDETTVYVTVARDGGFVSGKDAAVMAAAPVTVSGNSPTINDVFEALHEQYYDGTAGYATAEGQYSLSIEKFWGYSEYPSYYINDNSAAGLSVNVRDDDHLYVFFYQDTVSWSDCYTHFASAMPTVLINTETELELSYISGFDAANNWAPIVEPLPGAQITVDGVAAEGKVTDAEGKVSLTFDTVGTYTVSAAVNDMTIVPPVCKITVVATEAELPQTKTDAELIADAVAALEAAASVTTGARDTNVIALVQAIVDRAAKGVIVSDSVVSANSAVAADGTVSVGAEAVSGNVTFTLTKGSASDDVTLSVTVPAAAVIDILALMDNIAASYVERYDDWEIMVGMAAYEDVFPSAAAKTSATAKQSYINNAIEAIAAENAAEKAVGSSVVVLQAIGVDPQVLNPVEGAAINAITKLDAITKNSNIWNASYSLLAYQQGEYAGTDEAEVINAVLANQQADGSWIDYDMVVDSTAYALISLAAYYDSNDTVKAALDKAVEYLSGVQKNTGAFDGGWGENANSAAMVIMGLAALGINPDTDPRFVKDGNSVLDGLLSFAADDNTGFVSYGSVNEYATKQGFEALVAAYKVMESGEAYNIYDFSGNAVSPGYASGAGTEVAPEAPPEENEDITVTLSIKGNNGYWLRDKEVTVDEGSLVYHVLVSGIEGTGITQVGAATGYVSEMSYNGTTLGEFTEGELTGWLYQVNDSAPMIGVDAYEVEDGDKILFYYTMDYTQDSSSSGFVEKPKVNKEDQAAADEVSKLITAIGIVDVNSAEKIKAARAAFDKLTDEQKKLVEGLDKLIAAEKKLAALTGALPFSDVTEKHWANDAIRFVFANDLMDGIGDGKFAPDTTLSRAMVLTMLYRLAGEPAYTADKVKEFSDVKAGLWYSDAVNWAVANNIVIGYDDGTMGTNDDISREQLAVMLYRFAELMQHKSTKTADISTFADAAAVGSYAGDALEWANGNGFITGRDNNALAPKGDTLRGEAATVLMRYCETFAVFAATK